MATGSQQLSCTCNLAMLSLHMSATFNCTLAEVQKECSEGVTRTIPKDTCRYQEDVTLHCSDHLCLIATQRLEKLLRGA